MSYGESDYIHISDWMWAKAGLGLKIGSVELALFARVHGFSRQGAGEFFELQQNTANLFEVSREAVNRSMKALVAKGCVVELGVRRLANGRTAKVYSTQTEKVTKAMASFAAKKRSALPCAESSQTPAPSRDLGSPEQPLRDQSSQERSCDGNGLGLDELIRQNAPYSTISTTYAPTRDDSSPVTPRHSDSDDDDSSSSSRKDNQQVEATQIVFDEAAFAELCRKSLKPVWVTSEDDARAAYARALGKGYTPEQIDTAYCRYIKRYRNDNPGTPRYAKRLDAWLDEPNGLAWDAPKPRKLRKPFAPPKAPSDGELREKLEAIDPEYCRLRASHVTAMRSVVLAYTHHETEDVCARANDEADKRLREAESYFELHKQAVM